MFYYFYHFVLSSCVCQLLMKFMMMMIQLYLKPVSTFCSPGLFSVLFNVLFLCDRAGWGQVVCGNRSSKSLWLNSECRFYQQTLKVSYPAFSSSHFKGWSHCTILLYSVLSSVACSGSSIHFHPVFHVVQPCYLLLFFICVSSLFLMKSCKLSFSQQLCLKILNSSA